MFTPGTVSHGTFRAEDLIPRFLHVLYELNPSAYEKLAAEGQDIISHLQLGLRPGDNILDYILDVADEINGACPDGYYFGTHEGDGSDYGFWETSE